MAEVSPPAPSAFASRPRAPRPGGRSARVRSAVIAATIELLAQGGWQAVSVDAIAKAAGVNRTTIYRRWPSVETLVADALWSRAMAAVPIPDTGDVRSDLLQLLEEVAAMISSPTGRALINALWRRAEAVEDDPIEALRRGFWSGRFARAGEIVRRGVARGEIAPGLAPEFVVEAVTAPLYFRLFISGAPLDAAFLAQVVDLATAPRPATRASQ